MHRSVIFQYILGGFLLGVALVSFFVIPDWTMWVLAGSGALCLLVPRSRGIAVGVLLLASAVGVWRTQGPLRAPSLLWDIAASHPAVVLDGYVSSDATATSSGMQYRFHVVRADWGSGPVATDDELAVFGSAGVKPRYGQVYQLSGTLQRPKNSGDFDYISYLAKGGAHALIYFPGYSVPLDWQPSHFTRIRLAVIGGLHNSRDALVEAIARAVPEPEAAYLGGILLGGNGIVPADIKTMFANTGTSHILAISGYNITVVAAALAAVLASWGRRRAFWASVIGITVFTVMTGASASVVRAAVMGVVALMARQFGRAASAATLILFSAAIMCVANPLLLRWDIGFQLSFLALVGIVYLEPLIVPVLARLVRWPAVVQTAATTIAASIAVLPLLLFDFGILATYTLPTNLLVLPLVPLAMALGFATAIAGLVVPFAGQLIGQLAWLIAAVQLGIVRFFAHLPHAALAVQISPLTLVATYASLFAFIVTRLSLHHNEHHPKS